MADQPLATVTAISDAPCGNSLTQVRSCYGAISAVSMRARQRRKDQARKAGRRWLERYDDAMEMRLLLHLATSVSGDTAIPVDYRALALEVNADPGRLREVAAELAEDQVVVLEAEDDRGVQHVWLNPSIAYAEGTDVYAAARRHRFPQFQLTDGRAEVTPFESITWQMIQYCDTTMFGGHPCGQVLSDGMCPDHARDTDRAAATAHRLAAAARNHERFRLGQIKLRRERARVRTVACPDCKALPGEHCRTVTGERARSSHSARRAAATAQAVPPTAHSAEGLPADSKA
ncbi:hypothetical protein OG689_42005 [Kitasatospora sp. NBC_00240]|uniref:zinc finger domain-containing protein n=1 Tax=Kitasatospora sp. NBC_00240 TaxID=2903567 RepID=UPI00225696BB|nr:hypothetical protein [Kitasatospora sp. NBC_00240]MCX5215733.1 hypothetical protein [Kitasatospora sp. NBC_00240]